MIEFLRQTRYRVAGDAGVDHDIAHMAHFPAGSFGKMIWVRSVTVGVQCPMRDQIAGDKPNDRVRFFDVAEGKVLLYEDRGWTPYGLHGFDSGNAFYGTERMMPLAGIRPVRKYATVDFGHRMSDDRIA